MSAELLLILVFCLHSATNPFTLFVIGLSVKCFCGWIYSTPLLKKDCIHYRVEKHFDYCTCLKTFWLRWTLSLTVSIQNTKWLKIKNLTVSNTIECLQAQAGPSAVLIQCFFRLGFVMDNHLNRHTYGFIQSRLVPFYLHLGSACAFFNLTIYAVYHPSDMLDERESFQVCSFVSIFLFSPYFEICF